jgi:hypothetical protein
LIAFVRSEARCQAAAAAAATAGRPEAAGASRAAAAPRPVAAAVIEPAPEGAKSIVKYSNAGGYYDDVYVRTPLGWRFKSRNVISDPEVAAGLSTQDFVQIRQLAGDDHGHYEDVYGEKGKSTPLGMTMGADHRPFRASGLTLALVPEGLRGTAYIRNNGGHYEDLYVKTPEGWRIKSRVYVGPSEVKAETK